MINQLSKIISFLLLVISFAANGTSVYPDGINITPASPTTSDFIVADIYGFYATPGYSLVSTPSLNMSGNDIEVDFLVSSPDGSVIQVLDPFSYLIDIGELGAGDYNITANFYVDGFFDNTINNNFTVTAVPVPPAISLFLSGIVSIYTFTRKKKS